MAFPKTDTDAKLNEKDCLHWPKNETNIEYIIDEQVALSNSTKHKSPIQI